MKFTINKKGHEFVPGRAENLRRLHGFQSHINSLICSFCTFWTSRR